MNECLTKTRLLAIAIGVLVGALNYGEVMAGPGPNINTTDSKKVQVLCEEKNGKYDCDVKGVGGSAPIKTQSTVPAGAETVTAWNYQTDAPPPDHEHTAKDPVEIRNGKHCWIQVNGTWTSVHC